MASSPVTPASGSWSCILPGPLSRNNGGAADLSLSGLLAFASGNSIPVVDSLSMQLISVLPMPPPSSSGSSSAISPFVTSVRWMPQLLHCDLLTHEPCTSSLFLAAGDRQGRIALFDFRLRSVILWFESADASSRLSIQDLCWIQVRHDSWILASLSGSSILSLYSSTGYRFWKYDSFPEFFSSIRRDPFDSRHFCVLGLKGILLSALIHGDTEESVTIKELRIEAASDELQKAEKDVTSSSVSNSAMVVFPLYMARFAFSPHWRHILFATFPREVFVFDLQYEKSLFTASLPRGCGKFLDVLPDPNSELLYCAHLDGKLSIWKRKEGEQMHILHTIEEIIPSIGTSIPHPSILSTIISDSDSSLRQIGMFCADGVSSPDVDFDTPLEFSEKPLVTCKTHLVSITDDGKIWNWLLTVGLSENAAENSPPRGASNNEIPDQDHHSLSLADTAGQNDLDAKTPLKVEAIRQTAYQPSSSCSSQIDWSIKIELVGQLHLLSSTVTMLAVPSPSLTAVLARGGTNPAVAVPLVALGTQNGTIDVVDVYANAVAASFSAHNNIIRGLRFLGNSRLVSFSSLQVNEKNGGYINRLVVTCLRSGLNREFRILQRPERAPVRALRASSSGRYLVILLRDAPVEVWAMTKAPIMVLSPSIHSC